MLSGFLKSKVVYKNMYLLAQAARLAQPARPARRVQAERPVRQEPQARLAPVRMYSYCLPTPHRRNPVPDKRRCCLTGMRCPMAQPSVMQPTAQALPSVSRVFITLHSMVVLHLRKASASHSILVQLPSSMV